VDIDSQAVETTKLSLLLKLMEGEILESAGELFKHSQKALLPDLKNNIKCGNSLIGSDFYTDKDMSLFGNEEIRKINTFDWEKEFPEIFYQGGFDCVIGNPPYVRQEMISEHKEYFEKKYKSYHGMADLFTYFIEIGLKVLKNERILSFIISNRFSFTNYGENLRLFLNNKNIEFIINFNGLLIFENANVDTMIIKIKNNESDNKIKICNVNDSKYLNILDEHIEKNSFTASKKYFSKNAWGFHQDKFLELRNKIIQKGISLSKVENIKVNRGITTGLNDIFIINEEIKNKLVKENPNSSEILKPILKGADIKRWFINDCKHFLIYSYTDIEIRKYTAIFNYLSQFKKELENVWEAKNNKKKWYELRGCNYYSEFAKEKIIWTRLSNINSFAISKNKEFSLDSTSFLISNAPKYYCALLNSKVIFFYFKLSCVIWGKDGIKWFGNNFDDIPLHIINFNNPFEKQSHDQLITLVDQMLEAQKEYHNSATDDFSRRLIKQKIDAIDTQIDNLVYKLYDLTDEEIRVVEGS
ncbi:MAG: Eco57I restriction-modification methylase domain-containing protein, partial [Ignavibacteriales bacterium]|nr:Eco57I restriction-modification methylase domain-containing protein [Ignavibacteriales bacterium]